jgi:hypothetical protein
MCFIFGIPAPLVRGKKGEEYQRKKEKYVKTIVINDLHFMFCCLLLHAFLDILGGKKNENKGSTPECSCFYVTFMHLQRKKLEMERYVSDALHFVFKKLF